MSRHDEILLLCHKLGAEMIDNFRALLPDSSLVNFAYRVDGLRSFADELKSARRLRWFDQRVAVLPLDRICASKAAVNRPKDRVHLFYIRQAIELQRKLKDKRRSGV